MRYLPSAYISGFWQPLRKRIAGHLESLRLLRSWKSGNAACISKLKIVPTEFLHDGLPLVEDLQDEIYLGPEYESADLLLLHDFGLAELTAREFLRRLSHDLTLQSSRLRTMPPNDAWHSKLSATLLTTLEDLDDDLPNEVRQLELIPLRREPQSGESFEDINRRQEPSWVSAESIRHTGAYFPYTIVDLTLGDFLDGLESIPLPRGLHTSSAIIWPLAVKLPERKALFSRLGATNASSELILRELFLFNENLASEKLAPNLGTVISQLRYMFWFYESEAALSQKSVFLFTDQYQYFRIGRCQMYLKSDVKHGAWELLKNTAGNVRKSVAHFLNDKIMTAESESVVRLHQSWTDWLSSEVGIKVIPPLVEPGVPTQLGKILLHVLDTEPTKFVTILQEHWETSYGSEVRECPAIINIIKAIRVPCQNGMQSELCKTLLPLESLKLETNRMGITCHIPFLDVSTNHDHASMIDWEFLTVFEVTKDISLEFFTRSLDVIRKVQVDTYVVHQMVSEVYRSIGHICSREMTADVREVFEAQNRIYSIKDTANPWRKLEDCVWEAPSFLTIKSPLAMQYGDDADIRSLFHIHLDVRNADYRDYLEQLLKFRNTANTGITRADCLQVYQEILADGEFKQEIHWDEIR